MHTNVHCSPVYNSQDMEATLMFTNRGMDKEDMAHIYNGVLLLLRHFSRVRLCVTPETAAHQSPPSLGSSSHKTMK